MEPSIIYETGDFVAINKPAGLLVHPTMQKIGGEPTLTDWLLERYPEICEVGDRPDIRPGIVHRLDKETSGVLVIARTQKFFEYLKSIFQKSAVEKEYLALVHGKLVGNGIIDAPIGLKSGTTRRLTRGKRQKMVKLAVTEYRGLEEYKKDGEIFSLVELRPKTGRTHQLRVHLLSINRPVVGDQQYGKHENPWGICRQLLHAFSMEFPVTSGKRVRLEASLPDDFRGVLKDLGAKTPKIKTAVHYI